MIALLKREKTRLIYGLIGIMVLIVFVTSYYYFQHKVAIQTVDIEGWDLDNPENLGVQIKQVRVYDWERRENFTDRMEDKKPVLFFGQRLPEQIGLSFSKTAEDFYRYFSRPYRKLDDTYRIEVSGVFLKVDEYGNQTPKFTITANGNAVTGEDFYWTQGAGGNLSFFTAAGTVENIQGQIKNVTVAYNWPGEETVKHAFTAGNMEKRFYTYYQPMPGKYTAFQPEDTAVAFVQKYVEDREEVDNLLHPEVDDFPWEHLGWLQEQEHWAIIQPSFVDYFEEHNDFEDVFGVAITFDSSLRLPANHLGTLHQLMFYMKNEKGSWQVVDVNTLS